MRRETNQKNDPEMPNRPPERISAANPAHSMCPPAMRVQKPYAAAASQENRATARKIRASIRMSAAPGGADRGLGGPAGRERMRGDGVGAARDLGGDQCLRLPVGVVRTEPD